ncbi:transglycosylase SLT domain-containing protein [Malikia sp.]|uniref:transglycosylase SLT domain-containing protein n=1 Tax=Malikia sp. TaxID=2070706 RepID=UPI00261B3C13|nr:transglycosylase SLT domain-containing protein [Malikia sp.]MDD2729817.1 transglycosylase SLT domain-containing protein [Malikia sp.]
MIRHRLWWPLLGALFLSACSSLPQPDDQADNGPQALTGESRYALKARRGGNPTLSELGTESSLGLRAVAPLTVPQDLWERIRRGFAMQDLENEQVQEREQWYAARPDYIERMTARSHKYLFHIVEELERRNMPTELALLPFVESAFNPQAVSSASAAGMWQFMPATGKDFDLKQNMFRDDRRDVLASTRAALDYLERLNRQFNDWQLALAAYNWGQGNVAKAIKRNQAQGLGTSYAEINLPQETRQYVPKLLAIKHIVARPERFRAQLPAIGNHPFFDAVPIQRDMDVAKVAELAGVSERDLRQLNPSINKPMFMAAANPSVLLPWDNAALFEAKLATQFGPLASWTAWRAPRDMSVAQAAEQHGIDEHELRELNKIPPRMLVKAGSTLLVPRHGKLDFDVPGQLADHGQLLLKQEIILVRTQVKARKGDTLAKLAQRYQVSADKVADWNDLSSKARLKPGQLLVLHLPKREAVAAAAGERSAAVVSKASPAKKGKQVAAAGQARGKAKSSAELKVALASKKR